MPDSSAVPMPAELNVRSALHAVLRTDTDIAPALARVVLALVMFPHGAQHLLGWFGGYGFSGTHAWMTDTLGFPGVPAAVAIVVEFVAPIALLAGIGGRVAATGIAGLMIGAALTHLPHGFFMNWFGTLPAGAEGFEYHILVIALALIVILKGSGAWSVDGLLDASGGRGRIDLRAGRLNDPARNEGRIMTHV